jgi:hypothetical protein
MMPAVAAETVVIINHLGYVHTSERLYVIIPDNGLHVPPPTGPRSRLGVRTPLAVDPAPAVSPVDHHMVNEDDFFEGTGLLPAGGLCFAGMSDPCI